MLVFESPDFQEDVADFGLEARIRELKKKLATADNPESAGFHSEADILPYWRKKYRDLEIRLIAKLHSVEGQAVFCLLRALHKKKGKAYDDLWESPASFERDHLKFPVEIKGLKAWIQTNHSQLETPKPLLPETMYAWLIRPQFGADEADATVLESLEWVRRSSRRNIHDYWETFHRLVLDLDGCTPGIRIDGFLDAYLHSATGKSILYATPPTLGRTILYLIAQFDSHPSHEELTLLLDANYKFGAATDGAGLNVEVVARYSQRSYPYWLLYDEECWRSVQDAEESNLALSPEEETILTQASSADFGKGTLPLFINGRAGSGKSTLLLYLFAEFVSRWCGDPIGLKYPPVFLTYNENLLRVAKESVNGLLQSHYRYVSKTRSSGTAPGNLDDCFHAFRAFLLDLVPPELKEHFTKEKFVSFHKFKQAFVRYPPASGGSTSLDPIYLAQNEQLSPELCWYVIRSFIKGSSPASFLDPDAFGDLPAKSRAAISPSLFKTIFDRVWTGWYLKQYHDGFWDDQDLVRAVIDSAVPLPLFGAVFCDEVQDFTRLELSLLLRLTALTTFDIGMDRPPCFPLAFAGDPFQTLNPTGFRWAAVSQLFQDEIAFALDPFGRIKPPLISFQDLKTNYRACSGLVASTNLVQLWRHVVLEAGDLVPQRPWRNDDSPGAQVFVLEEGSLATSIDLAESLKSTVVLVPCEEGQEADFVLNDPILRAALTYQNSMPNCETVMSAIAAKGLEFDRVILYKFGEWAPDNILKRRPNGEPNFEVEHYFNKLYVAVSRARRHLYIVDSNIGCEKVWKYATDPCMLSEMLAATKADTLWSQHVSAFSLGTEPHEMREVDPLKNAAEFRSKGEQFDNPDYLRRAAFYFERSGCERESHECKARAFEMEESFIEAGRQYELLQDANKAFVCYWSGSAWAELRQLFLHRPSLSRTGKRGLALALADFACDTRPAKRLVIAAASDIARFSEDYPGENAKQVQEVALLLADRAGQLSLESSESRQVALALKGAAEVYAVPDLWSRAAWFFAESKAFALACRAWEQAADTAHREYFIAKAALSEGVNKLTWLERARDYESIIDHGSSRSTPEELAIVCRALISTGQFERGMELAFVTRQLDLVRRAAQDSLPVFPSQFVTVFRQGLKQLVAMKGGVSDAIGLERALSEVRRRPPSRLVGSDRSTGAQSIETLIEVVRLSLVEALGSLQLEFDRELIQDLGRIVKAVAAKRQGNVRPEILAAAFENIEDYHAALTIYLAQIQASDGVHRQQLCGKWLTTKEQEIQYLQKSGNQQKIDLAKIEFANKQHDWRSIIQAEMPIEAPVASARWIFSHVPDGATVSVPENDMLDSRMTMVSFDVVLSPSKRCIVVQNKSTWDSVIFHVDNRDCKSTLAVRELPGRERIFEIPDIPLRAAFSASSSGGLSIQFPSNDIVKIQWPVAVPQGMSVSVLVEQGRMPTGDVEGSDVL